MPRTEGVSCTVLTRCSLLRPRPTSGARCTAGRRMGLPVCSTVTVFFATSFLAIVQTPLFFGSDAGGRTTGLQRGVFQAALCRDVLRMRLILQGVERSANHVVRVRRTGRLRNDVMHAERFENSAHRTTGDDAGTSLGGAQQDLAGAMAAMDVMMKRAARAQRNEDQFALGSFGCLADGFRHFARLAMTEANAALLVADDDESSKAETTAALY